jgi:DNA-binding HxlR family transcriptional regulator
MDPDLLRALKALSDANRLRILGLLANGSLAGEELARALGIGAPTVAHHLKRLRQAGLVEPHPAHPYVEWSLRPERLGEIGRALDALETAASPADPVTAAGRKAGDPEAAKVLRAFLDGDRLITIPAQERKRLVILRWLREREFAEDREYPEKEVNMRLALHHPDVAALRRDLVDHGLLTRSGGIYRLSAE